MYYHLKSRSSSTATYEALPCSRSVFEFDKRMPGGHKTIFRVSALQCRLALWLT